MPSFQPGSLDPTTPNSSVPDSATDNAEHDLCQKARQALHRSVIHVLHTLEVSQAGSAVVLSGKVDSYYLKQMAQEAIRAEMPSAKVINSVTVE